MSAFANEVAAQLAAGSETPFLNDEERGLFIARAKNVGQTFLSMVRSRRVFVAETSLVDVTHYAPIDMGQQEIEPGKPEPTLVFPSVSVYDPRVFALQIRTLKSEAVGRPNPAQLFDTSQSRHTVTMHDPIIFAPQGVHQTAPVVRRHELSDLDKFEAIFKEVVPFAQRS